MAEKKTKKLTQEELTKFNGFINKRKDILTSLGATELQLKNLKNQKDQLFFFSSKNRRIRKRI